SGQTFQNTPGDNTIPISDAIIYAKIGNIYKNYGISNGNGMYTATKLPPGSYTLVAHRMGFNPVTQNVTITSSSLQNINFNFGSPIGIKPVSNLMPSMFKLYQNYPNPFNPAAVIKFDIPKQSYVKLAVFDILGRESAVLVNENLKAGT